MFANPVLSVKFVKISCLENFRLYGTLCIVQNYGGIIVQQMFHYKLLARRITDELIVA